MPNSLKARLKKLVYQGLLTQKDLDRIEIIPANKNEKALKAAKVIKEYCKSFKGDCKGCMFLATKYKYPTGWLTCACKLRDTLPEEWNTKKDGEQDADSN